ncbi:MAG: hypothetical protein IJ222_10100 [Bacteroidales bacterium]|nr:hypothetical protein [Bacteroidales bacterium]
MEKKKLYPLHFGAIDDIYNWGSEHWRMADLGYRDTFITGGWLGGNAFADVMETYLDRITGDHIFDFYGAQFPFQIKDVKVKGKMPLRVSPDDEMARNRYDHLGKEKLWYIRSAGRDARLLLGFKENCDASALYEACMNGTADRLLNVLQPIEGQYFHIPPGTPHCAWGSLDIIEVSESSALDFLLCPWGQELSSDEFDPELNLVQALDIIDFGKAPSELLTGKTVQADNAGAAKSLLKLPQFSVNLLSLDQPLHVNSPEAGSCTAYALVKGSFAVVPGDAETLKNADMSVASKQAADTVLVPSELTDFNLLPLREGTTLLEVIVEAQN